MSFSAYSALGKLFPYINRHCQSAMPCMFHIRFYLYKSSRTGRSLHILLLWLTSVFRRLQLLFLYCHPSYVWFIILLLPVFPAFCPCPAAADHASILTRYPMCPKGLSFLSPHVRLPSVMHRSGQSIL